MKEGATCQNGIPSTSTCWTHGLATPLAMVSKDMPGPASANSYTRGEDATTPGRESSCARTATKSSSGVTTMFSTALTAANPRGVIQLGVLAAMPIAAKSGGADT